MNTKKAHSTDNIETCTLLLSHQRYSLFGMFSDSKSYVNLRKWLQEVVGSSNRRGGGSDALHSRDGNNPTDAENACDPEALIGGGMMKLPPMLVVGAKFDMVGTRAPGHCQFSKDIGADRVYVNCLDKASLASGSSGNNSLRSFFDKAIYRAEHKKSSGGMHTGNRNRRTASSTTLF
eukprot:m.160826 g.160826  ORF g.160826 m.160826 type:complete len:177 (-) comp18040_c0_seq9:736-1266(-)